MLEDGCGVGVVAGDWSEGGFFCRSVLVLRMGFAGAGGVWLVVAWADAEGFAVLEDRVVRIVGSLVGLRVVMVCCTLLCRSEG